MVKVPDEGESKLCLISPGGKNFSLLKLKIPVVTNEALLEKKLILVKLQSHFNDKDSHINSSSRSRGGGGGGKRG